MLLAQVIEDYWNEHAMHTKTAQSTRICLDHLKSQSYGIEAYMVSDLRDNVQRKYVRGRYAQGMSRSAVRNEMAYLKAALNHAKKNNRLVSFPNIYVPPPSPPRQRVLSPTEARALLDACEYQHTKDFILLALSTGQRKGVILNLKWFQVNFDLGLIDFVQKDETTKRSSMVAISTILRQRLQEMQEARTTEYVLEYDGQRVKDIKRSFATACRNAGIEGVTPHTLRHTAGSWMAQGAVSMHEIARTLGHASTSTTEKSYIKYTPDHTRRGVETVEILLKSARKEKSK